MGSASGRGGRGGDPLLALLSLPGVQEGVTSARAAVDALLWDRAVARETPLVAAESALRGAWANAWFEGAQVGLDQVRSGTGLDASPLGRLLTSTVAMHEGLASLVPVISTAPAQALARMHAVLATGWVQPDELGRPRSGEPDDPLRIGLAPSPDEVRARLDALFLLLIESRAPAMLLAAVAHGEIAAMRPFIWGSGLVARALPRLVLAARGVDPGMLGAPELGFRQISRHSYVRAVRGYASGEPEGVAELIAMVCGAVAAGAGEPRLWIDKSR